MDPLHVEEVTHSYKPIQRFDSFLSRQMFFSVKSSNKPVVHCPPTNKQIANSTKKKKSWEIVREHI